jgi:hypothetical protein
LDSGLKRIDEIVIHFINNKINGMASNWEIEYPKINKVLLWNLSESKELFSLKLDQSIQIIEISGLDAELVSV